MYKGIKQENGQRQDKNDENYHKFDDKISGFEVDGKQHL